MNHKHLFLMGIIVLSYLMYAAAETVPEPEQTTSVLQLPPFPPPPTPVEYTTLENRPKFNGSLAELSVDEARRFLQGLIDSKSEDQVVIAMQGLPIAQAKQIVERIIASEAPQDFKVNVIVGVASHYTNPDDKDQLFALFDEHPSLTEGEPLLLIIADSLYPHIIKDFLAWVDTHSSSITKASLINTAIAGALKKNNVAQLKILQEHARLITPTLATNLLWQAVSKGRSENILAFLVGQGADLQQEKDGKTLLVVAAERLDKRTTQALLSLANKNKTIDLKKWINRFVDPAVGTPLQKVIAIQKDENVPAKQKKIAVQLELILRDSGATIDER